MNHTGSILITKILFLLKEHWLAFAPFNFWVSWKFRQAGFEPHRKHFYNNNLIFWCWNIGWCPGRWIFRSAQDSTKVGSIRIRFASTSLIFWACWRLNQAGFEPRGKHFYNKKTQFLMPKWRFTSPSQLFWVWWWFRQAGLEPRWEHFRNQNPNFWCRDTDLHPLP